MPGSRLQWATKDTHLRGALKMPMAIKVWQLNHPKEAGARYNFSRPNFWSRIILETLKTSKPSWISTRSPNKSISITTIKRPNSAKKSHQVPSSATNIWTLPTAKSSMNLKDGHLAKRANRAASFGPNLRSIHWNQWMYSDSKSSHWVTSLRTREKTKSLRTLAHK